MSGRLMKLDADSIRDVVERLIVRIKELENLLEVNRAEELTEAEREDCQKLRHAVNTLCEKVLWLEAENAVQGAEVKALRGENADLRTALSGRTYCHSDEAVNAELAALREERDCQSGEERCLCFDQKGFPCCRHLHEEVKKDEAELTSLRGVVEKVREHATLRLHAPAPSPYYDVRRYEASRILSLLPEVPK